MQKILWQNQQFYSFVKQLYKLAKSLPAILLAYKK